MIKPFNDVKIYQSYIIDNEDYLDLLDPYIGEREAMLLGIRKVSVEKYWKPLDITLFQNEGTVDIPDISEWGGMLCLNKKAYNVLHGYLEPYGEFLPCNVLGKEGYLFHCLNIREFQDDEIAYRMHGDIYSEISSLSFPKNMKDHIITGINKMYADLYFSDEVAEVIEKENLKGLLLVRDVAVCFPY